MTDFYHQLAKAELHVHLEGSVQPETVLELDPSLTLSYVRDKYRYPCTFAGFLQAYVWVNQRLRGPEEYTLITRRLLENLRTHNVSYAEINLSVGVILWKEQDAGRIFEAVQKEAARSPVQVRWIFDAVRQFGPDKGLRVAELAVERKDEGVVAFGIGGDEERGPADWFADIFGFVKRNGLAVVPHAGETAGPESVWAAIRLGASRIGHGIRAVEDPELMRYLHEHNIPLEVCISSNVCTGVVTSVMEHPLRRLYEAGVPVVLSTDDPGLFATDISREYRLAAEELGFTQTELSELAGNSFRYSLAAM
jgi:adenosine deaminase/aminodeoxyfutalosine deaminase